MVSGARSRRAVIIGGGISGILTARELALAGWQVTVLEAAHVGAGSSSRTAAGIRQQFSTPETVRGMRYSVGFYQRFAAETSDGGSPIQQNGYLFLYQSEEAWTAANARVAMQRSAGLTEVEALAGEDLTRRFPWVAPDTFLGGSFCPTDGFLFPAVVYGDGAQRARALGVEIVQGAPVQGAVHRNGQLASVITPRGEFGADLFFDCTNAWSPRLSRTLGAEALPIEPLKRYLWFVARDGSFGEQEFARMPLVVAPSGVYGRPENSGSLLMGWAHTTAPEFEFSYADQDRIDPGFSHGSDYEALPFRAWASLAEALPPIGEFAGITATTAGFYATTPDHNPFFGFDRTVSNLVRLVGFSGHGAMFGPFTALVARHLAEAGRDLPEIPVEGASVSLEAFRIGRAFGHAEAMVI
jgi:sarcosine oxidase subunit beta